MSDDTSPSSPIPLVNKPKPSLYDALKSALGPLAGQANDLPESHDLKLHRSLDRNFAKALDGTSERVMGLASGLLELVKKQRDEGAVARSVQGRVGERKRKRLTDEDDVVHGFRANVQEAVDSLLEATV